MLHLTATYLFEYRLYFLTQICEKTKTFRIGIAVQETHVKLNFDYFLSQLSKLSLNRSTTPDWKRVRWIALKLTTPTRNWASLPTPTPPRSSTLTGSSSSRTTASNGAPDGTTFSSQCPTPTSSGSQS